MPMAKQLSPRKVKITGIILLLLSVAALCFCGEQVVEGIHKSHTWNKTTATVTHLEQVRGKRGRISYKACFSFRDPATNHSYSVKSKMSSSSPSYRRGQKVEMLYSPEAPEEAVVNTFVEIYFWAIVGGIIGAALGLFGWAALFDKQKEEAAESTQEAA